MLKRLVLATSLMIMAALPGWGQATPQEQARAGAAAHKAEAKNNPDRPHHRRKHRRHHRHHNPA